MAGEEQVSEKCVKCNGMGWYQYDHNHSTICDKCCTHDQGWWELTENYSYYIEGADNRCCEKGCGTMARDLKDREAK